MQSANFGLLSTHGLMLLAIAESPLSTLRELGDRVGISERSAHRIVTELTDAGYLVVQRVGRRNEYAIRARAPLRHPLAGSAELGDLLRALQSPTA